MKYFFIAFLFARVAAAQTLAQCRQRYDAYLNFRGSLDKVLRFEKDALYQVDARGKRVLAIYADEVKMLADYFANNPVAAQVKLLGQKGLRHFTGRERDSLLIVTDERHAVEKQAGQLPLAGYRIAIDPGHFATGLAEAQVEQKYLYFARSTGPGARDSIKLFESQLTFSTARILQGMLEEQGAKVMLTRSEADFTSFNCTYTHWYKTRRHVVLDSLRQLGILEAGKYRKLMTANPYQFFWDFFRDYDLANRAAKINAFAPHLSVVIHYNVDEKNDPWKKTSAKNYCMTFIGGAFTAADLARPDNRAHFFRLLLTDQLNRSQQLAAHTVLNFNKKLNIPIARQADAVYLKDNCLPTSSPGVYCRNLILCRRIASPLVYGESLYQDNEQESLRLMQRDLDLYGMKTNARLADVAWSYYDAVLRFLKNE